MGAIRLRQGGDSLNPRFLFRCDCDGISGFGHFSRCVNLARALTERAPPAFVAFWGGYDDFADTTLRRYHISRFDAPAPGFAEGDVAATLAACREFDAVIVDSYRTEQGYIAGLAGGSTKLIVLDDMHALDLSDVDLVVNFRVGMESVPYGAKQVALGVTYLLVKPELRPLRTKNLAAPPRPIEQVLVFFSGGHTNPNVLERVVAVVQTALPTANVSYFTRDGNALKGVKRARPLFFTPDIETFYAQADLVVTGGGLVKYESAYCGIPNVALSQTALQDQDTKLLAERNLTFDLGLADRFDAPSVAATLARFTRDPAALAVQHRAFRDTLFTDSPWRLADRLLSL